MHRWFIVAMLLTQFCGGAAAVSISSFSPTSGQPGNVITITGSGFSTTTNFAFNSSAPTLADFVINSDSQLTVVVPIGATSGPLRVATSGNGTGASSSSFTVAPVITSFSSTPSQVYILGANFIVNGTTVTFSGTTTPVNGTVTASTVVSALVPGGAVTGPITVTTSAGSAVSTSNFDTGDLPIITGFTPTGGAINSTVTINGGNFFNPITVKFNGTTASATVTASTQISATVPTGATTGLIEVTTDNGSVSSSADFLTGPGPIVTNFVPAVGEEYTVVTNYGLNLMNVTNVTLNGVKEYISGYGSGYLLIEITNAPGSGLIKLFSPQGNFTDSPSFTYSTTPIISSFAPTLGAVGSPVVINGYNFTSATSVKFGSVSATFTLTAGTQINATVPNGAVSDPITVTTPSGSGASSSNFVVTTAAPVITGFTPTNGVQGMVVTINGAEFTNLQSIEFNGVTASYQTPTSTTVLYATVPTAATSGLISVKNSSGTGTSSTLFYLQPWITNATGSNVVNSSLVIQGRNLTNAISVQVDGVNYPSFTNSPTQIVAAIPSNAMTGHITVTTPGGIFISTNLFVVLPQIYSFSPTIGPAGTVVTIDGTSLFDVTSVEFNGTSATPFNVMTNQLQVDVPTGATPGPITVITPGGKAVTSSNFTATYSSTVDLSKTVSPIIIGPGTNVTYTIMVTNTGPSTVTSVSMTDNIPTGFNLASSTSSLGTTVYTNNMLIASIPILTNNTSATITVKGTSTNLGALTNTANLGFAEGNTIYGTNYAYVLAYVISAAQRTLSIAPSTNPGKFLLTWPVSAANLTLQVNTNLSRTNGWQSTTNSPFVTNGLNEYTNTYPANAREFFRLQGP